MPNPSSSSPCTRRDFIRATGAGVAALATGVAVGQDAFAMKSSKPNFLFIAVDDLSPQMGCYGFDWMKTPHLDALAARGTLFENNFSQYPICGPSRASLMSGLRPAVDRFRKWNARVDADAPGVLTLPEHFLRNGYTTACVGKVFHDLDDNEQAWSRAPWRPEGYIGGATMAYALEENRAMSRATGKGPAYESAPVNDGAYGDAMIAERAMQELRTLAESGEPFFLAAGFLRPHLPFNAPDRYWAMYDPQEIPMAPNPFPPANVPPRALHDWQELRNYAGMPKSGPVSEEQARMLTHGYAASISYMDAQIGAVLDELDRLKLRDNTIVVFWADHGWQTGQHGLWTKHCLFENAVRTPLIVAGPGVAVGQRATGLAENLDLYPTLCELAALPAPPHLQGESIARLLKNPAAPGKEAAFSRHDIGESIRTDRFRYSEWRDGTGTVVARMLYDHANDPQENVNVAEDPSYAKTVLELSSRLHIPPG